MERKWEKERKEGGRGTERDRHLLTSPLQHLSTCHQCQQGCVQACKSKQELTMLVAALHSTSPQGTSEVNSINGH